MPAAADPLASVAIWDAEVEIGGTGYLVAGRDAAEWLKVLLDDPLDLAAVLPGMLSDDDQDTLEELLLGGQVAAKDVQEAALHLIGVASGREYWWTLRLLGAIRVHWVRLFGPLVASGMRLRGLPFGSFLDAIYHEATNNMKPEARRELDRELETPPPGEELEVDEDQEASNFLALMNQGV